MANSSLGLGWNVLDELTTEFPPSPGPLKADVLLLSTSEVRGQTDSDCLHLTLKSLQMTCEAAPVRRLFWRKDTLWWHVSSWQWRLNGWYRPAVAFEAHGSPCHTFWRGEGRVPDNRWQVMAWPDGTPCGGWKLSCFIRLYGDFRWWLTSL